jgi:hypothetical protein
MLYPREIPGTHCIGGWVSPRAGLDGCWKWIRSPDRSVRNESLYRLSYRGPQLCLTLLWLIEQPSVKTQRDYSYLDSPQQKFHNFSQLRVMRTKRYDVTVDFVAWRHRTGRMLTAVLSISTSAVITAKHCLFLCLPSPCLVPFISLSVRYASPEISYIGAKRIIESRKKSIALVWVVKQWRWKETSDV